MKENGQQWKNVKELSKTGAGISFTIFLVQFLPHCVLIFFTRIVSFFYVIFCKKARQYSRDYQKRLIAYSKKLPAEHAATNLKNVPSKPRVYSHITSFAIALVEKIEGWSGKIKSDFVEFCDDDVKLFGANLKNGRGSVLFCSHLGNIEIIRSIATSGQLDMKPDTPMSIIMDLKVTQNFTKMISKLNSKAAVNLISPENIGIETISVMQDTIEKGGLVVIAADRISANSPERKISADFLGSKADFPYGPYLIASILKADVFFMFSMRKNQVSANPTYSIKIIKDKTDYNVSKTLRDQKISEACKNYAFWLEKFCLENPFQWYNFYKYWPEKELPENCSALQKNDSASR